MRYLFGAVLLCFMAAGAASAQGMAVITTTGQATVEAVPDMGVTLQADKADKALMATSEGVGAILKRLQDAGVAPRDMQTDNFSLQPVWTGRDGKNDTLARITGFVARNSLLIRVRDLSGLGRILDLGVQDGANTFDGLSFGLQDPKPAADTPIAAGEVSLSARVTVVFAIAQ